MISGIRVGFVGSWVMLKVLGEVVYAFSFVARPVGRGQFIS